MRFKYPRKVLTPVKRYPEWSDNTPGVFRALLGWNNCDYRVITHLCK